jgi:hypothetical protein
MFLIGGVLTLIALGVWLFALFDVLTTDEADVQRLPKFAWLVVVLLGFDIGAIIWLIFGRPRVFGGGGRSPYGTRPLGGGPRGGGRPDAPKGPEDDPEFLRNLDRRLKDDDGR